MRDVVYVHVTADLPIRMTAQPFADRVELRLGQAYPVVLGVQADALTRLTELLAEGHAELRRAARHQHPDPEGKETP
jgi:hypothetical protein